MPFAGWSPIGIAALLALAAGIVLLVAYAARRGLVDRELEGLEPEPLAAEADGGPEAGPGRVAAPPRRSRTLGVAGALLLVVGLALGAVAATGAWSTGGSSGAGLPPADCAQTWQGCPQATPPPTQAP